MSRKLPTFTADQTLPTPDELKSLTSLSIVHKRPQEIIYLDEAYKKYYDLRKSIIRSYDNQKSQFDQWNNKKKTEKEYAPQVLFGALNALGIKKSSSMEIEWTGVERNKNQVLEKLYNYIRNEHPELVGNLMPASLFKIEIPSSRLGVLFLFSNIRVELAVLSVVIEAANTGLDSVLDFDYIGDTLKEAKISTLLSVDLAADKVVTAGAGVGTFVAEKLDEKRRLIHYEAANHSKNDYVGIDPLKDVTRARGNAVVDFTRARSDAVVSRPNIGHTNPFNKPILTRNNGRTDLFQELKTSNFQKVWKWVKDSFYNLCMVMLEKFYWVGSKITVENAKKAALALFKKIAETGLKKLLTELLNSLSGLVGGIVDAVKAFGSLLVAGFKYIQNRSASKKLNINPGHPALIVQALTNAVEDDLKSAGIDAALASMNVALLTSLTLASAGTSNLVTPIVSAVVKTLKWFYDTFTLNAQKNAINSFSIKAKKLYDESKVIDPESSRPVPKKDGICFRLEDFTSFFNEACEVSNALPLLAFRSGIVGNAQVFISLLNDRGELIIDSSSDSSKNYLIQQADILTTLKNKSLSILENSKLLFSSPNVNANSFIRAALLPPEIAEVEFQMDFETRARR